MFLYIGQAKETQEEQHTSQETRKETVDLASEIMVSTNDRNHWYAPSYKSRIIYQAPKYTLRQDSDYRI